MAAKRCELSDAQWEQIKDMISCAKAGRIHFGQVILVTGGSSIAITNMSELIHYLSAEFYPVQVSR